MSIRNLDKMFKPRSVAIIGASNRERSVGRVLSENLLRAGFKGPVMPVNPKEHSINSVLAYNDITDLPVTPDLAVICTPPQTVPGIIETLGKAGTKAAVVITAGFGELGEDGKKLQQQLLDAAQPHLMRLIGPNCLGIMVPGSGINASFAHVPAIKGDLAFVTQSGAVLTSVLDWAHARRIGFSHMISLGSMADVDFGDMLDYLTADPETRAILLYIEAIKDSRKFMSAARAAARTKPVIVVKSGRSALGAKAASSHTGALAGSDAVYDCAFQRAGMLRVDSMDELFDAVETLATGMRLTGERLAILTNGGGIGVMATDTLAALGGNLAELEPGTMEALNAVLPPTWSHGNPVDIIGDAPGERYAKSLEALLKDKNTDAVLVMNCPTAIADSLDAAQAVIHNVSLQARYNRVPVLTSWLGETAVAEARHQFALNKIPTYETPDKAVRAFMHLVAYRRNQALLMETPETMPDSFRPDDAWARTILQKALKVGRDWLTEPEAKQVLEAYQIPIVRTVSVSTPEEAASEAGKINRPVALKILSYDITHKSDVGGVALHLETPEDVQREAEAMLKRVGKIYPGADIQGFTVQEMADMPGAHELILGMVDDADFGPVILFGQGGTAVEVLDDKALVLPPLNLSLARQTIEKTQVYKLLQGYRDRPASDIDGIALTMTKIAQMVIDLPEIAELDINPLFANQDGVLALDARIKVRAPAENERGSSRLAIRPYPRRLEKDLPIEGGETYFLRPIRPEDEPALQDMIGQLAPEDIRLRFFSPLKRLPRQMAARLTQIDYDREMALVALPYDSEGMVSEKISGVVRISADPDNIRAEYSVMILSNLKGKGLGRALMQEIVAYAQAAGIGEIFGEVLQENQPMLRLCDKLGFTRHRLAEEPGVVEVRLQLGGNASAVA